MSSEASSSGASHGTSTKEWDFEPAIDLIRLQTDSLLLSHEKTQPLQLERPEYASDHLSAKQSDESFVAPLLGDFEKLIRSFGPPAHPHNVPALGFEDCDVGDYLNNKLLDHGGTAAVLEVHENDRTLLGPEVSYSSTFQANNTDFQGGKTSNKKRHPRHSGCQSSRRVENQEGSESSSDIASGATGVEAKPVIQSQDRRKVIQDFTGLSGFASDGIPTKKSKKAKKGKKPVKYQPATHPGSSTARPKPEPASVLAVPDRKLKIMRMLGMEIFPSMGGSSSFLPYGTLTGLSFLPSQIAPMQPAMNGGIHVFVDISNVRTETFALTRSNGLFRFSSAFMIR
jgi:hypothetical protein